MELSKLIAFKLAISSLTSAYLVIGPWRIVAKKLVYIAKLIMFRSASILRDEISIKYEICCNV